MTDPKEQSHNVVERLPSLKEGACLMAVQIQGSCGEATLSKASMVLDGQEIKSELVKGTTLQWFPKERLRFLNTTVQRVNRLLSGKGVSFGKALTLIPLKIADEVQSDIDLIKAEFDDELLSVVNEYETIIKEHKLANPDIANLIDKFKLESGQFVGRFIFKCMPPMAVQPLFESDEEALRDSITQTLWEEIAAQASKLATSSFIGKERCSQKAVSAVKKLKNKLINLAFLDDGVLTVANSIQTVLDVLPKSGPIENGMFHRLANYVQTVSKEENLRMIASGNMCESDDVIVEQEAQLQLTDLGDTTGAATQHVVSDKATSLNFIEKLKNDLTPAVEPVSVFDELDFPAF